MATRKRRDERVALCVGLNNYPQPYTLGGGAPDARSVALTLSEDAKYESTVMVDNEATKAFVEAELLHIVRATRAPGNIIFYWSGHGTNLLDTSGDEIDGRDEALVPIDFLSGNFIRDDDLHRILSELRPGVGCTVIADSCYSGTFSRIAPGREPTQAGSFVGLKARYIPHPLEILPLRRALRELPTSLTPREERALSWVEVSACSDTELSYESQDANGVPRGHFTRAFEYILRHSAPSRPLKNIIADTRAILAPVQTPQITIPDAFSQRWTLVTNP